jgi:TldD protein
MGKFEELFMHQKKFIVVICLGISMGSLAQINDPLLKIADEELTREMNQFKKAPTPPYFVSFRITDLQQAVVHASFGSLVESNIDKARVLATQVRVGDYQVDNTHALGGNDMSGRSGSSPLPIEDNPDAVKYYLWQATQKDYKQALQAYKVVKSSSAEKISFKGVNDFSVVKPVVAIDEPLTDMAAIFNKQEWELKTKELSRTFLNDVDLIGGDVSIRVVAERKYFLSSEGSRVVQNATAAYINVTGSIRANDGEVVPLHLSYFSFLPSGLPATDLIQKDIAALIEKLKLLKKAPLAEPYTGPAILHAQTAGVFFHEIFGHRVEGHRLKDEHDGQTFKAKIGEQVLPLSMDVVFDPTKKELNGLPLNGYYRYDDEGVPGQRVQAVSKGLLKTFLMSRTPLEGIPNSNGHGRADSGETPVSRQSNLVVTTSKSYSMEDLRKMLVKECQKQGKPYGYFFRNVIGGFTTTERQMPNAFNIFPTEVYRVYVDGRADELVRGVDLIGTPLAMFAEIDAAGNVPEIFTGFCGAESGSVPVSAVSPALFVKRIETQKKAKSMVDATLLNKPSLIK